MRQFHRSLNPPRRINSTITVNRKAALDVLLRLVAENAGSSGGILEMFHDSSSPAANDEIGRIVFYGRDSGANKQSYCTIDARIDDPAAASEDSNLTFTTTIAGTETARLRLGGGLYTYGATGGDKGNGTINAESLYMAGNLLPITKEFISSGQTITSAGSLTIAHSLGVIPRLVQIWLTCATGESGYTAGDQVVLNALNADASRAGVSIVPDATNLNIRYGNSAGVFLIVHKTSGALAVATNANWTAVFKAWA